MLDCRLTFAANEGERGMIEAIERGERVKVAFSVVGFFRCVIQFAL
jgi:hypothetical protein